MKNNSIFQQQATQLQSVCKSSEETTPLKMLLSRMYVLDEILSAACDTPWTHSKYTIRCFSYYLGQNNIGKAERQKVNITFQYIQDYLIKTASYKEVIKELRQYNKIQICELEEILKQSEEY